MLSILHQTAVTTNIPSFKIATNNYFLPDSYRQCITLRIVKVRDEVGAMVTMLSQQVLRLVT